MATAAHTLKANIQTPGLVLLLGSQPGDGNPYQILNSLWRQGPRWYWSNVVQPYVDSGVDRFLIVRPFGEVIKGDEHQDLDTLNELLTGDDADGRGFAESMLRETVAFFAKNTHVQPTIYLGAMTQPKLTRLIEQGKIAQWAKLVASAIEPWITLGDKTGVEFHFVCDYASRFDQHSLEWAAYSLLSAMYPGRFAIEASPSNNTDSWGTPSWLGENLYQRFKGDYQDGQVGKVTRYLRGADALTELWPPQRGELVGFILDCHAKGHECFVSEHVRATTINGIDAAVAFAQRAIDQVAERDSNEQKQTTRSGGTSIA